ncbi:MAG TPA: zf-HC2 domain-containing protein [Candidatus Sulfotelmatobacter sp.]|jgi:hypothetical protein
MVNREANCELVWKEISNYIEGDVDAGLRAAMDEHFRTCQRCASVLAGTRNVIALYGDERMIDELTIQVPAGYGLRLEKSIEKRLAQTARAGRRWPTWSTWLVPLAAMGLFAGGLHVANSMTATPELKTEHGQPGQGIPPDMLVVVTKGARLFHAPGCGAIHNKETERTIPAKEAMAQGYVPCLRCLRQYMQTATAGHVTLESEAEVDEDVEDGSARGQ